MAPDDASGEDQVADQGQREEGVDRALVLCVFVCEIVVILNLYVLPVPESILFLFLLLFTA